MEYVTLGKTGLRVSRVGFGGIPIQRISSEACSKLFDSVVAHGINYIDTARAYTVSEAYLGEALRRIGEGATMIRVGRALFRKEE